MLHDIKMYSKIGVFKDLDWIDCLLSGSLSGSLPFSVKQCNEIFSLNYSEIFGQIKDSVVMYIDCVPCSHFVR